LFRAAEVETTIELQHMCHKRFAVFAIIWLYIFVSDMARFLVLFVILVLVFEKSKSCSLVGGYQPVKYSMLEIMYPGTHSSEW